MRKTSLTMLTALAAMLAAPPAQARANDARFLHFGAETEAPRGYTEMCQTQPELCRLPAEEAPEPPGGTACAGFACLMAPLPSPATWRATMGAAVEDVPLQPIIHVRQPTARLHLLPLFRMMPATRLLPDDGAWLEQIARINAHVNRHVRQVADLQTYGREDVWRPAGTGPKASGDCEDLALEKRQELIAAGFPASRLFMAIAFRQTTGLHAVLVARLPDGDRVLDSRDAFVRPVAKTGYAWLSLQRPEAPERWSYPA
jgi:predicted transglutaminase-like cysteine proteinase